MAESVVASAARERAALPARIAIVAITRRGARFAARLAEAFPEAALYVAERWRAEAGERAQPFGGGLSRLVRDLFTTYEGLVFFTAVGIAVRLIAPHLRSKHTDPAVVAVDDAAHYAVSVLSGHRGGGNALAARVGALLGATPVLTTASEAHGTLPVDLLGREFGWQLEQQEVAKDVGAALVNGEPVGLVQEAGERDWWEGPLPPNVRPCDSLEALAALGWPGLVITDRCVPPALEPAAARWVLYRPRTLVLGVGASSGVTAEEIEALVRAALAEAGLAWGSLSAVATLDRRIAEPGLVAFATRHRLPLRGYPAAELAMVSVPHPSAAVARHVGTPSVCEAAACLAAGGPLVVSKRKGVRATVALARRAGL